ncbi:MAG: Iron-sulfur cluster-binding protein [uncultured Rubrobacteraceae bacterium]|uniref:Iron-sulfur cluster-binding protein n=1 Tax=uncultured Rubrobacteraceae bacterium TaxID=349277 RepID=A0A6J4Q3A7_9ACTN|nr:MAG: Iron-sulfur cluster-binding protein [uncultured Rubrobacteraceae bacterium]
MQTKRPVYKEIEDLLEKVELPRMALVEQSIDTPTALPDIGEGVREALRQVELPSGSVAIGVGSRGVGGIGPVVKALVGSLKEAGAEPFVVPAMGSHGASTAEGQALVLEHLGVGEEEIGCPIRATMESILLGETSSGVDVFMDKNAYEADAVIVVNRVKPHTAFRGTVESGPTKMLAIGLGKQKGAHSVHSAGWADIHRTIPEAARVVVESGKAAFGLAVLENAWEKPYKVVAIPAGELEETEAPLLEEAKQNLLRLPFDAIDVLVVDEIGKNISGDGADPNVTGRYPTHYATGGPEVERMVFLDLTEETGGNANGVGIADVVTECLASKMDRPATYLNALTSTTPQPVKLPMVMPTDRLAIAAALEMCAGVSQRDARLVRIKNTLKLRRMHISEALLPEVEEDGRLRVVEEPAPMRFGENGSLI